MVGKIGGFNMSQNQVIPKGCTDFGMWVFREAARKDWKLNLLADKIGISEATLKGYMTGVRYPKLDTYLALCELFSDSPEELWKIIQKGFQKMPEYQFTYRRLRYRASKKKNKKTK
jgi:transcriptional regulator with XRE-family HTH domain